MSATAPTFRPGTPDDSYGVFYLFEHAVADLVRRFGGTRPTSAADPEALARMWTVRRPLYEHLAHTADQFWIAERDGQMVGFARSVVRGGTQELTELFVLPGQQAAGLGGELLARAFPDGRASRRVIIASPDAPALALYLKQRVYPRFPIYGFDRPPHVREDAADPGDLAAEPITATPEMFEALAVVDEATLDHRRDADHAFLLAVRQGFLYRRRGRVLGYGYVGQASGPFALLDPADFPAVLAHAETVAAAHGGSFSLEVPLINQHAVDTLLARGYKMNWLPVQFMSNIPFGHFDRYIVTAPPFFM